MIGAFDMRAVDPRHAAALALAPWRFWSGVAAILMAEALK